MIDKTTLKAIAKEERIVRQRSAMREYEGDVLLDTVLVVEMILNAVMEELSMSRTGLSEMIKKLDNERNRDDLLKKYISDNMIRDLYIVIEYKERIDHPEDFDDTTTSSSNMFSQHVLHVNTMVFFFMKIKKWNKKKKY